LSEVRSIKLIDEGTRRDVSEFANASASARRRDAKTIVVTSEGSASREMLVSYTIAAPIWKTTYRVVLDSQGKPFFQGWAIVDNVSEEDWNNISLSLVSGSPVSFIQPIQKPFYRYRPVVPMPSDLRLDPQTYEPGEGGNSGGGGAGAGDGAENEKDREATKSELTIVAPAQRQIMELPSNGRTANNQSDLMMRPGFAGGGVLLSDAMTRRD